MQTHHNSSALARLPEVPQINEEEAKRLLGVLQNLKFTKCRFSHHFGEWDRNPNVKICDYERRSTLLDCAHSGSRASLRVAFVLISKYLELPKKIHEQALSVLNVFDSSLEHADRQANIMGQFGAVLNSNDLDADSQKRQLRYIEQERLYDLGLHHFTLPTNREDAKQLLAAKQDEKSDSIAEVKKLLIETLQKILIGHDRAGLKEEFCRTWTDIY